MHLSTPFLLLLVLLGLLLLGWSTPSYKSSKHHDGHMSSMKRMGKSKGGLLLGLLMVVVLLYVLWAFGLFRSKKCHTLSLKLNLHGSNKKALKMKAKELLTCLSEHLGLCFKECDMKVCVEKNGCGYVVVVTHHWRLKKHMSHHHAMKKLKCWLREKDESHCDESSSSCSSASASHCDKSSSHCDDSSSSHCDKSSSCSDWSDSYSSSHCTDSTSCSDSTTSCESYDVEYSLSC